VFIACGTSYHACLAMRPIFEGLVELPVVLEIASDFMDRGCPVFRDDTCVFVSQSGETADTLAALRYCKRAGALCVGVTNIVGSSLSRETECGVHLNAGYEMGVASTKAYTSQMVVLVMMALLLVRDSISKRELRDHIADELLQLPQLLREALQVDTRVQDLAKQLQHAQSLLIFGRGFNFATALEAALKVKEIALIHSEGIQAGELKHGALALVDPSLPVLVIATKDSMYQKMLSVVQQLKARGAKMIVVCSENDSEMVELVTSDALSGGSGQKGIVLHVPFTVEALQPVVNAIPMQLLAYHLTLLRGHNVDQPRNLAKSVTVTE
jgi:glutamine---fructose-6-phosphate transaminase (isomerizing)